MAFMQKQSFAGTYYIVKTEQGTSFVPSDVCGMLDGCEVGAVYESVEDIREGADWDNWQDWVSQLRDYVEGRTIREISASRGTLYRLSAPGYLDCTDWTPDADSPEFGDDDADADIIDDARTYTHCDGESGAETVKMTGAIARQCSHSGPCDDDVEANLDAVTWLADAATIRATLRRYGAYDATELADDDANRRRMLWIAAGDITENPAFYRD